MCPAARAAERQLDGVELRSRLVATAALPAAAVEAVGARDGVSEVEHVGLGIEELVLDDALVGEGLADVRVNLEVTPAGNSQLRVTPGNTSGCTASPLRVPVSPNGMTQSLWVVRHPLPSLDSGTLRVMSAQILVG
jgi:hypothetical protein